MSTITTSRTGTGNWKRIRAQAIHEAQTRGQHACPICGTQLDYTTPRTPASAEADHIIPHARGGQDQLDNIRIICRHCNQSRGAKPAARTPQRIATTTTYVNW